MIKISSISKLPNVPAVYVLFGGKVRRRYVAYVGIADKLKRRIEQHLVTRDSSVATGTSATGLNPDHVTELRWWEHSDFGRREVLIAAELVAFDYFQPTLRSRGNIPKMSLNLAKQPEFREKIENLLRHEPNGRLVIPTLQDALKKIEQLDNRITSLEEQLDDFRGKRN